MKMKVLLAIQLISVTIFGCEKREDKDEFPIEFSFSLINEKGEQSTTFKKGENFTFSFKINNEANEKLFFNTNFINDSFFLVYSIENSHSILVGKPFKNAFCMQVAGQNFFSLGYNEFNIPWVADSSFCCPPFCEIVENELLEIGKYKAIIKTSIIIQNEAATKRMDKSLNYEINFKILN